MIQAYQGHFQDDGRFIADNAAVKIPAYRRVIINILDEIIDAETIRSDEEEIAERLKMVEALTGIIPPDADEKAMRAERIAKRELLKK